MLPALLYLSANEGELNSLLEGKMVGHATTWDGGLPFSRLGTGDTGVLLKCDSNGEFAQPLAIVSKADDHRRLFSRFAQLRTDLSPLSAWCHLLTPERMTEMRDEAREAELGGLTAAWTGLIVAEALILADRSVAKLRLAACLATQSFAVARTRALWNRIQLDEVLERREAANRLVRINGSNTRRLEIALRPHWVALSAHAGRQGGVDDIRFSSLAFGISALGSSRRNGFTDEGNALVAAFDWLPEADFLGRLDRMTPESRVGKFDELISALTKCDPKDERQAYALAFLAGYVATIAAGGAPSLALTSPSAARYPEVTAWAYLLGGVGERVTWSSGFEGLGRLVARELERPFRLSEPPTCDFALDEATVVADKQLSDPLVHLKLKQQRVATVALLPGVNVALSLGDQPLVEARQQVTERPRPDNNTSSQPDFLNALANALLPILERRLAENQKRSDEQTRQQKRRKPTDKTRLF